jgi:ATP-dependent helicase HepA
MHQFIPGQRWVSETEPELGLGTILSFADRQVAVTFPAVHETRIYAADNPPLTRAIFKAGDTITTSEGRNFTVQLVTETDGLVSYQHEDEEISETVLSDAAPCSRPQDRLLEGSLDAPSLYALRHDSWRYHARLHESGVHGLNGARIDLLPHQLYIAAQACNRMSTRVLLADEVGLGKTIEACLILHRLLLTGRVMRVLIVVPEALVHQWFVELLRRFNLSVAIYDEERCFAAEPNSPDQNPFLDEQIILASEMLFRTEARRYEQAIAAEWDMIIVDEAHHLQWSPESPGKLYTFVDTLAATTPNILLLTATPEGLGPESHFSRLRLLDPQRYPSYTAFQLEGVQHIATAQQVDKRLAAGKPVDELLDRYGPGRVMFRNSRKNIAGFPERQPHFHSLKSDDARCEWLAGLLRSLPDEKILVIGTTRRAIQTLSEELPKHIQVDTALFHEDMSIIQRDRSAAWFSETDGARLLLCSEIGGEGRNFQFAHHMVLYDLPENPELLEQRIGRLDRIGQREIIHIHVPYVAGSPEESRMRWLRDGLEAFTFCLRGGSEIYEMFKEDLDGDIDDLLARTREYKKELYTRLDQGTSRLLEMHSFDESEAGQTVSAVKRLDDDPDFEPYLLDLLDYYGIHAEEITPHSYQLLPGHTFKDGLPHFDKEGMTITLDRRTALDREDWTFMTWDHPLVLAAMDQLLGSRDGTCTFVETPDAGNTMLVEASFILEVTAPPALEADRFLTTSPLRVTIDLKLEHCDNLDMDLPEGQRSVVCNAGDAITQRINAMLDSARETAEQEAESRRASANANMHRELESELARLAHLAELNDHVHPDELTDLAERIERVDACIAASNLRLDAVRLILA